MVSKPLLCSFILESLMNACIFVCRKTCVRRQKQRTIVWIGGSSDTTTIFHSIPTNRCQCTEWHWNWGTIFGSQCRWHHRKSMQSTTFRKALTWNSLIQYFNCFFFRQISAITADNVDTYKNAVNKLTDCMDANIKTMYTVMAKTEELSNKMKSTEALAARM